MARAHQTVTDFDALTDTDITGRVDGDGFRFDAASGELVPARIEVFHGEVADEAAMLALTGVSAGDEVFLSAEAEVRKLIRLPSNVATNWIVTASVTAFLTADLTTITADSTAYTADVVTA